MAKSITVGASASFNLKFIQAAVTIAFSRTLTETYQSGFRYNHTAPIDKNVFFKVYGTYRKYEILRKFKNEIIAEGLVYEPTGAYANYREYPVGTLFDQSLLYEKYERCTLIETNEQYQIMDEGIVLDSDITLKAETAYWNTRSIGDGDSIYTKFKTPYSGYYEIKVSAANLIKYDRVVIYEVDNLNENRIRPIAHCDQFTGTIGNGGTEYSFIRLYIESNKKYMLKIGGIPLGTANSDRYKRVRFSKIANSVPSELALLTGIRVNPAVVGRKYDIRISTPNSRPCIIFNNKIDVFGYTIKSPWATTQGVLYDRNFNKVRDLTLNGAGVYVPTTLGMQYLLKVDISAPDYVLGLTF